MSFSFKVGTATPISTPTATGGRYGKPTLYRIVSANVAYGTKDNPSSPLTRLELVLDEPSSETGFCHLVYSNLVNANGQANSLGQGLLQALVMIAGVQSVDSVDDGKALTYRKGEVISISCEHFPQLQNLVFGGVMVYSYENSEQYGFYFNQNGERKISTKNNLRLVYNPTTLLTDVQVLAGETKGSQENIDDLAEKAVANSHYHFEKFAKAFSHLMPFNSPELISHANWIGFDLSKLGVSEPTAQAFGNNKFSNGGANGGATTYHRNAGNAPKPQTTPMPQGNGYQVVATANPSTSSDEPVTDDDMPF